MYYHLYFILIRESSTGYASNNKDIYTFTHLHSHDRKTVTNNEKTFITIYMRVEEIN